MEVMCHTRIDSYDTYISIGFCLEDNVSRLVIVMGLSSLGFSLFVCLQGASSVLSPIFMALIPSLVWVSNAFEKRVATRVLRINNKLKYSLVTNKEIKLDKLVDH